MYKNFETRHIDFIESPEMGICFTSGENVYNECLLKGHYVCNLRSAKGKIKRSWVEKWNDSSWVRDLIGIQLVESFILEIDGQLLKSHWEWVKGFEIEEDYVKHGVVELKHGVRPVRVRIHTKCDGSQFIERWIEIINEGDLPAALSRVSPISGMLWHMQNYKQLTNGKLESIYTLGYYGDTTPGREGNFVWKPLNNGEFSIINKQGRSGWGVPYFLIKNKINGENFVCHMEWSCNWKFSFDVSQEPASNDSLITFNIDPYAPAPMKMIAPGETIISPRVHLGHIVGDMDECVNETYRHLRKTVLLPCTVEKKLLIGQGRVVTGDEEWFKKQIDIAADMGMEYFEFDAGWYGLDSKNWWPGRLGDWDVTNWNKNGFKNLREYIHSKGMLFGVWMEPEAMGLESEVRKNHPNWTIKRDGESIGNDTLLDLSRDEVAEWVESEIIRVIREYKPDYFKIDFNRFGIGEEGQNLKYGYIENSQWGHVKSLYRIFDKLKVEFPDIILENCAAGGGRNDLGMVRRCHISCQSDFTIQPKNLIGLNGMTIAYPPEVLRHYYPMQIDYSLYGDMDFQFRVMMLSNPIFIEVLNSAGKESKSIINTYSRYINFYKDFVRKLMPECKVYHHTPFLNMDSEYDWCVLEYASNDLNKGLAVIFHLGESENSTYLFKPKGLNPEFKYKVLFDNEGYKVEKDGYLLINEGISIRLDYALSSQLLVFEKV